MELVSLFDGIAGFPEAFRRAGVPTVATCEIDKAAAGVAAEHFPDATHFHDVTELKPDDLTAAGFDPARGILSAGWPCTDLSLAGLRMGLGGARSGLVGQVFRILADLRPRWVLLENVPGLLSSVCPCPGGGACDAGECVAAAHTVRGGSCGRRVRAGRYTGNGRCMALHGGGMGTVLRRLGELGYGVAYRVLDAQHFGVPQRRGRVVIVGHLGDWAAPVEVLLEPDSGPGHPTAGGRAWSGTGRDAASGTGESRPLTAPPVMEHYRSTDVEPAPGGGLIVNALTANMAGAGGGPDDNTAQGGHLIAVHPEWQTTAVPLFDPDRDTVGALTTGLQCRPGGTQEMELLIGVDTYNGSVGQESITIRGTRPDHLPHILTEPVDAYQPVGGPITHALTAEGHDASEDGTGRGTPIVPVAFGETGGGVGVGENLSPSIRAGDGSARTAVAATAVRRLTPLECERLQGFPDGWTATSCGRAQSDSARYRQLGNSIAVPVFAWVARRIVAHEEGTL